MRFVFAILLATVLNSGHQANAESEWQIASPNGAITTSVRNSPEGKPEYRILLRGRTVVEWSPLGLTLAWVDQAKPDAVQRADFAQTVRIGMPVTRYVTDHYKMATGKRRDNHYVANELNLQLTDQESGKTLNLIFQIADDGVAFRYALTEDSSLYHWIEREQSSFTFGTGGTNWGQVYDKPSAWTPAYESPYNNGLPISTAAIDGPGWGIPALFRDEGGAWILLHEAGLTKAYHGSHLKPDAQGVLIQ